ncbi:MAG: phosphatase PAP2 family protein [Bacteroidota bacterium]
MLKILVFILFTIPLISQQSDKVYHINKFKSGVIIVGGAITNGLGRSLVLQQKDKIPLSILNDLSREDVWSFDRIGLDQNIENRHDWESISDLTFTGSNIIPFLLLLDKDILSDWLDFIFLYLETQVISSNAFTNNPLGPILIDKFRPRTYYTDLPIGERDGGNNKNSFFSGHASITASATFFMVKVYADYHPNMKGKFWLYAAAAVPPAFVGLARVKSLFHFPSDVIVGTIIGAAVGILNPQLHKRNSNVNLSLIQQNNITGVGLQFQF